MLFSVVEGRAPKAASTLTLGDVNLALTKIHNAPDATERKLTETAAICREQIVENDMFKYIYIFIYKAIAKFWCHRIVFAVRFES